MRLPSIGNRRWISTGIVNCIHWLSRTMYVELVMVHSCTRAIGGEIGLIIIWKSIVGLMGTTVIKVQWHDIYEPNIIHNNGEYWILYH